VDLPAQLGDVEVGEARVLDEDHLLLRVEVQHAVEIV